MKILSFLFCLFSLVGLSQSNNETKPTTIFLVRHAERAEDGTNNPSISKEGEKRAQRLVEILSKSGITAIYSTNYQRTIKTVEPLAKANNLEIKIYVPMEDEELKKIVEDNQGGVIVICGHSNTTPWSANFLAGTKLEQFNDSDYENILIVSLWDFGKASLARLNY